MEAVLEPITSNNGYNKGSTGKYPNILSRLILCTGLKIGIHEPII